MSLPEALPNQDSAAIQQVIDVLDIGITRASEEGGRKKRQVSFLEMCQLRANAQWALLAKNIITRAANAPNTNPREQRIAAINGVADLAAKQAALAEMSLGMAIGNLNGSRHSTLSSLDQQRATESAFVQSAHADQLALVVYALGYSELRAEPAGEQSLPIAPEKMQLIATSA
jgi:hypothetical protein